MSRAFETANEVYIDNWLIACAHRKDSDQPADPSHDSSVKDSCVDALWFRLVS